MTFRLDMLATRAGIACALLATGCPETDPETTPDAGADATQSCPFDFVGDPAQDVAIVPIVLGVDGKSTELHDGDDIPLIFPPQGGRVVFVGARAQNLDPCAVVIGGTMRDPVNAKLTFDNRTINLRPGDDGWATSLDADYNTFSNIPICPNQWGASKDAFDQHFEVEISVKDRGGRKASAKVDVVPRCAEPENLDNCKCICKFGYTTGEQCSSGSGGAGGGG